MTLANAVYEAKARLSDERTCWRGWFFHRIPSGNDCCGRNGNCADRGCNGSTFIGLDLADDQNLISPCGSSSA